MVEMCKTYKRVFKDNDLDIQIMPLRPDNKNPIVPHKGGVYDENKFIYNTKNWTHKGKLCNFGLLMNEQVFCIDLDGVFDKTAPKDQQVVQQKESAEKYYKMFSEKFDLSGAWIEKTRKGYHLIWKKCDELKNCTCAPSGFKNAGYPGIDFVTISKSIHNNVATKSILAIHPSTNKNWISSNNPLNGHKIQYPPDNLVNWINENLRQSKSQSQSQPRQQIKKKTVQIRKRVQAHGTEHEINELKDILDKLPPKYYEDESHGGDWQLWFRVMLGIQYIMGESGYDTWVQFNKKSCIWDEDVQETNKRRYWDENIGIFTDNPVNIGSFRYWIQNDNPEAWIKIKQKSLLNLQLKALNGSWFDLAILAAAELPNVCYDTITNTWCKFEDGVWYMDYRKVIVDLNEIVANNFKLTLTEFFKNKKTGILATKDIEENERNQKLARVEKDIKKVNAICLKIGNEPDKLKKQLKEIVGKEIKFDKNPWLLGFKNGWVYDLKAKMFRQAEMDDMVSMKTNYSADEVIDVTEEQMQELKQVIEDILPDKEARDYQFYLLALALNGIEAKRFCCQNGSGANGKSTLFGLLKVALGDYCKNISTMHYTKPMNESGPRPDLLDLQNTRLFIATEPSEGERFNSGAIKKITGGDPIRCRGMWSGKTIEFYVVGQSNVLCNDKPDLEGIEGGLLRRIVNFVYPVKFVSKPDPNNPYEKPINMKYKSEEWYQTQGAVMLKWLINLHNHYLDLGQTEYQLQPPSSIVANTKEWVSDSMPFKSFLESCYRPMPRKQGIKLKAIDAHMAFRESDIYMSMTKKEKRTWSKKNCIDKLLELSPEWKNSYDGHRQQIFWVEQIEPEDEPEGYL